MNAKIEIYNPKPKILDFDLQSAVYATILEELFTRLHTPEQHMDILRILRSFREQKLYIPVVSLMDVVSNIETLLT